MPGGKTRAKRTAHCSCKITIVDKLGDRPQKTTLSVRSDGRGDSAKASRTAAQRLAKRLTGPQLSQLFASLGHAMRLRILGRLLQGSARYQDLQKSTGLSGGPLYHHLGALKLSGVIVCQRDDYSLTGFGRQIVPIVAAIGSMSGAR